MLQQRRITMLYIKKEMYTTSIYVHKYYDKHKTKNGSWQTTDCTTKTEITQIKENNTTWDTIYTTLNWDYLGKMYTTSVYSMFVMINFTFIFTSS